MSKHNYRKYEKEVTLCAGIADLHPYKVTLPDAPAAEEIINYGLPPEKQRFRRVVMPEKLKQIDKWVKTGSKNGVPFSHSDGYAEIEKDPELTEFVETLWKKRTGEIKEFQYINGTPLHISPTYWFYLNFWQMPQRGGAEYPEIRFDFHHYCTDLWFFIFWDYIVVPNPYCMGAINFTQRQVGKSYVGGCLMFEFTSRVYDGMAGCQSKTDDDMEKIYYKCIVRPWQSLPFFFQPYFSNSTNPKQEGLSFTPHSKKGKGNAVASMDEGHIMGKVTYRSSGLLAYDGDTLDRYFCDEAGKTTECDVYERWNVVKEAMRRKGGKAIFTTTVEEMEKLGGKFFKAMWDDSNRNPSPTDKKDLRVDANGETVSGLYPWFVPSYCNEHFDEFGKAITDKITEKEKQYLKSVAHIKMIKHHTMSGMESVDYQINKAPNAKKRQEIIRKKPRNIREAFASSNTFSYFNMDIIRNRVEDLINGYRSSQFIAENMKFGRFRWKDGIFGGEAEFVETDFENARCHVFYMPPEGMRNLKIPGPNQLVKPGNTAKFRSGADPFKYDTPDVKNPSKMSDGAQHIYAYYDDLVDGGKERKHFFTNNFVYEYLYRPASKDELFEDYLLACVFYGCALYPERNNAEVLDYFRAKGFKNYIQHGLRTTFSLDSGLHLTQDTVGGNITNDKTIQSMFRHIENFVNNDLAYCPFYRTIYDIRDVERENLNPYDLFVSAAYTLMASYEAEVSNQLQSKNEKIDAEVFEAVWGDSWN